MSASFEVTGYPELSALGKRLKDAGSKDLPRELRKGLKDSAKHVEAAVRRDVDDYLPAGYEDVFKAAMHFTTEVRLGRGYRVTVNLRAKGAKGNDRQVTKLEAGELRHPVYGRWRARRGRNRGRHATRNPWAVQRIRAHFFTEPAKRVAPAVRGELQQAMHRVAEKIVKG